MIYRKMKISSINLLITLVIICTTNNVFSQNSFVNTPNYNWDLNVSIKRDYQWINMYDINELIDVFITDFETYKDIYLTERIIPKEYKDKLEVYFKNLKENSIREVDFDLKEDGVLGRSKSFEDDERITLTINPRLWYSSSRLKQLYVIYHELGHDILNFNHGEGGKMMFTLSQKSYSYEEFGNDRGYMFFKFFDSFFSNLGYKEFVLSNHFYGEGKWFRSESNQMYYLSKPFTGLKLFSQLIDSTLVTGQTVIDDNIYNRSVYYKNGFRDGEYLESFQNGRIKSSVIFKNDKPVGKWRTYFSNGKLRRQREFDNNGLQQGEEIEYFFPDEDLDGYRRVTNWKDNLKNGKELEYDSFNQLVSERTWVNGEIHGDEIFYFVKGGKISNIRNWNFGKLSGKEVSFYNDGSLLSESYWEDGYKKEEKVFSKSGLIERLIVFKKSYGDKEIIIYQEDGSTIIEKEFWEKGEKVGLIGFHPNGKISYSVTFLNNEPNGQNIGYFENGVVRFKREWSKGKKEGEEIYFHQIGTIKTKVVFKNGFEEGPKNYYNSEGELFKIEVYDSGEIIETILIEDPSY